MIPESSSTSPPPLASPSQAIPAAQFWKILTVTDFQDVTTSGGFGHLQKGHGIAFGDIDNDGGEDIFDVAVDRAFHLREGASSLQLLHWKTFSLRQHSEEAMHH